MKISPISNPSIHTHLFFCPGCKQGHGFSVPPHTYNNDPDKPTVRASLLVGGNGGAKYRCHSYITDGKIQFLDDCTHDLKGQTVELPEL
jgi:hypothetical protein